MASMYQRIHDALAKHGPSPAMLAEIDSIFSSPVGASESAAASSKAVYDDAVGYNGLHGLDGFQAYRASLPPMTNIYGPDGRMLDVAGRPIDSSGGGAPANDNLVGGIKWVTLQGVDSTAEVPYTAAAGKYWLEMGEQPDQSWTLTQGGTVIATGNGSSDEAAPFALDGPGVLAVAFNANAISTAVLAQRVAAGQGVSKMHYTLRAV